MTGISVTLVPNPRLDDQLQGKPILVFRIHPLVHALGNPHAAVGIANLRHGK